MNSTRLKKLAKATALFIVVSATVCAGWRLATRTPDPVCDGRRLSEWVSLLGYSNGRFPLPEESQQAREAIQKLGTKAVPSLLSWMAYEPPMTRYNLIPVWRRLPRSVAASPSVQKLIMDPKDMERTQNAIEALVALGPAASSALPELTRRATQPYSANHSTRRYFAFVALAKLGQPAVPVLAAQLSSPYGAGDPTVISSVLGLGTNARPLISIIIKDLADTNAVTAFQNVKLLGLLKLEPDLAVPALTKCLQDARPMVRSAAVRALMGFGGLARGALPALTNALSDVDSDVRRDAATACKRIAIEVQSGF